MSKSNDGMVGGFVQYEELRNGLFKQVVLV